MTAMRPPLLSTKSWHRRIVNSKCFVTSPYRVATGGRPSAKHSMQRRGMVVWQLIICRNRSVPRATVLSKHSFGTGLDDFAAQLRNPAYEVREIVMAKRKG